MGLTIHWQQANKRPIPEKKIQECLGFVEEMAQAAGWEILAKWDEIHNADDYQADYDGNQPFHGVVRERGITIHPHEDSESIVIDFVGHRLGTLDDYGHYKGQRTRFFCKTHYSNFATHKAVCKFLYAISQNYVSLEVSDEGDYYGVWDDVAGKKAFGEYVAFVHDFGKQLAGKLGVTEDQIISSEDSTNGWKDELVDHYAEQLKNEDEHGGN